MSNNVLTGQTKVFNGLSPSQNSRKPKGEINEIPCKVESLCDATKSKRYLVDNHKKILGNLIAVGDLVIFWGCPGTGKSMFTYQLAQAVASGKHFFEIMYDLPYTVDTNEGVNYKLKNELPPQVVLYVDLEMTTEQICSRYSNKKDNGERTFFEHHENLKIPVFEPVSVRNKKDYIYTIEKKVQETKATFVIIDNMSVIVDRAEDADMAKDLMRELFFMMKRNNLTLVLVAHSNKMNEYDKKSTSQIKGSSNLTNFATAIFCLSRSRKDPKIRYILQQKCRFDEELFKEDHIIELEMTDKMDNGNIGFTFNEYDTEDNELKEIYIEINEKIKWDIKEILSREKKISVSEIVDRLLPTYGDSRNKDPKTALRKKVERIIKKINME